MSKPRDFKKIVQLLFSIGTSSVLFGAWQHSVLAGVFMVFFMTGIYEAISMGEE